MLSLLLTLKGYERLAIRIVVFYMAPILHFHVLTNRLQLEFLARNFLLVSFTYTHYTVLLRDTISVGWSACIPCLSPAAVGIPASKREMLSCLCLVGRSAMADMILAVAGFVDEGVCRRMRHVCSCTCITVYTHVSPVSNLCDTYLPGRQTQF